MAIADSTQDQGAEGRTRIRHFSIDRRFHAGWAHNEKRRRLGAVRKSEFPWVIPYHEKPSTALTS